MQYVVAVVSVAPAVFVVAVVAFHYYWPVLLHYVADLSFLKGASHPSNLILLTERLYDRGCCLYLPGVCTFATGHYLSAVLVCYYP